jgi:hypothetical protein
VSGEATNAQRQHRLELDLDLRLLELWQYLPADGDAAEPELVSALIRAAYGCGYTDALKEETPGSLLREHGYPLPASRRGRAR